MTMYVGGRWKLKAAEEGDLKGIGTITKIEPWQKGFVLVHVDADDGSIAAWQVPIEEAYPDLPNRDDPRALDEWLENNREKRDA